MDIQVTEESVFVNGKEVYNKISDSASREIYKDWEENGLSINLSEMYDYSSGSSLIKPKDESEKQRGITIINIDQAEQRMNVIGQNGNDGLHYGVWKDASYQFWEEMNNDLMNKDRNLDIWESDH